MLLILLIVGIVRSGAQGVISQFEYWFDHDAEKRYTMVAANDELTATIDMRGINLGSHLLAYRTKTTDGRYSPTYYSQFFVLHASELGADARVTHYEYWFDGEAASRQTIAATEGVMIVGLDVATLPVGVHVLAFRAKTTTGRYSPTYYRYFFVLDAGSKDDSITHYEYWFDSDAATRHTIAAHKGALVVDLDTKALATGGHLLAYRAKTAEGRYSSTYYKHFFVLQTKEVEGANKIEGYEYWFDQDATTRRAAPTNNGELVIDVDANALAKGVHVLS